MILFPLLDPVSGRYQKAKPKPAAAHHNRLSHVMKVTQTTDTGQYHSGRVHSFGIAEGMICLDIFHLFFD
ncbi:hypothetical protein JHL17_19730 [Azospirillum sp. YIM B02556]|uniref:Uncharacterized protein n=1 Tax=Azospirillum endophyticum TaxID=2800326 RepID=A0ABS1F8C0_9PROT|nr:hypothetical protein [Azospirillum endophyticum]MBK1839644.1 hypothetical protein [Azospirillum endophyticum]